MENKDKRNEAIALYMGYKRHKGASYITFEKDGKHIYEATLQYHSSWDWLMPVCKKMSDQLESMFDKRDLEEYPIEYIQLEDELLEYNIEGVFKHLSDLCQKLNN
jgi:hypothetical protein